ncbi:MAG: ABC transporter ATP-binding protein [Clostridiales bacterium]|nr:ABC transporter ATP-binding protein [Clostridiales bacterium]
MSIEVRNLDFSYGARRILHDVGLSIEPMETLTILGPNGAGKTTLLNIVAGLLPVSSGSILYDGKPAKELGVRHLAQLVGYVPQNIVPAFDYSVLEYVVTGCAPRIGAFGRPDQKHYDSAAQAIQSMGIGHLADKSYRQISGGEQQQVSVARVLAQSPAYILMDEPTSHLDYGNQIRVLRTIKQLAENGFGVVFTTHNPDQALLIGGKAAIIGRDGRLTSGYSRELITEPFLSELYGIQLRVSKIDEPGRRICFMPSLDI